MTDPGTPVLVEQVNDDNGTYEQQWYCQPPPKGVAYLVTDCTWTPDHKVRKIFSVQLGRGIRQR